ncbi:TldD/PmbA family protein [Limnothrix redekei]|uniref:TldD/PmbA family protein n=1 Tax=Limnothrix redekei LRLZ20PSL1 TaxID=3112953 RepID=A0ABW7CAK3_9CYAN
MAISIEQLATDARDLATNLGIKQFDLYGSSVDETSVKVRDGEPEQVKASQRSGVTVRVWSQDGRVGITSTTDIDRAGLELALRTASEASAFGATDNVPDFSPEATQPIDGNTSDMAPPAPINTLITALADAEKRLLDAHPAITSVPYNGLSQSDTERFYLNSEGALRHEARSIASMYLYAKTEQEGRKPRSGGAFRMARSFDSLDLEGCLQETTEKTLSHLNYDKIQSGKYPIVFSPEAFLSLLGAFSNLFNAQSILDKQSLSTPDSLGQTLAASILSLADDEHHPGNIGASWFDGEGTPTRRIPLITDGQLTNFLHSAGTAKRLGAQPTGHANMGAKVTVSPGYWHVFSNQPGDLRLADAEQVILVDDVTALHAGVNALEGSFSLPFDGWMVKRGDRVSIESATIAGDIHDLLKSIICVEPEAEVLPGGTCPRIWVAELSITGD